MKKAVLLLCITLFLSLGAFSEKQSLESEARSLSPALASLVLEDGGVIPGSEKAGQAGYWETKMDIADEKAVWDMLMAPIYVVKGNQKQQIYLLAEPKKNAKPVAELTQASQGVHVLETLSDGWSLVEIYSSSFYGSKLKRWNELVKGYVQTSKLQKITPNSKYGLVADKLSQRLYIFKEGKLLDYLRISTGLPNKKQPFNETRSGEFLFVSAVGGFWSDNMFCEMAIRFNDGDLLHEVPHIPRGGNKNYGAFEERLGQRASHGCIRVQRRKTDLGINMAWIWKNIARLKNVKFVVWEDAKGRLLPYPEDERLVYVPKIEKNRWYHDKPSCANIRKKLEPMQGIAYSELENDENIGLRPCTFCVPPLRRDKIDEINEAQKAK